jgi:hypothetical protein
MVPLNARSISHGLTIIIIGKFIILYNINEPEIKKDPD